MDINNNEKEIINNCHSNIENYNKLMNIFKQLNINDNTNDLKNLRKNINHTNIFKKKFNLNEYDINTMLVNTILYCEDLDKYIKDILSVTISEYFKNIPILTINKNLNISKHFSNRQVIEKNGQIIITKKINFLQWFLLNISPLHFLNSDYHFSNIGTKVALEKGFLFFKLLEKYLNDGKIYKPIRYNILYKEINEENIKKEHLLNLMFNIKSDITNKLKNINYIYGLDHGFYGHFSYVNFFLNIDLEKLISEIEKANVIEILEYKITLFTKLKLAMYELKKISEFNSLSKKSKNRTICNIIRSYKTNTHHSIFY